MHVVASTLKCHVGHEPSTCFFRIGIFWGGIYEIFDISKVSYFLCKLGTKVNQCAFVSSVFDYFWIYGGPASFGQNGDEGRWCLGGESSKSEITSMIKQHIGMLKMIFAKKHGVAIM